MIVEKLKLRNFRNIEDSDFYPIPAINFLVGENGQGKTSFIEALNVLSTLRSFRESKNANLIRWGQQNAEVSCTLSSGESDPQGWTTELKVNFVSHDAHREKVAKVAFINDKPYRSSTQFLSQRFGSFELGFHSIVFNPSDHDLVRGDPATRRAYLNRVIAAEDIEYLKVLQKYQRVLEQRNALLKAEGALNSTLLSGFSEQLCLLGVALTQKRLSWIQRLAGRLNETLQKIAPGQLELRLVYLSNWLPAIQDLSINNNKLTSVHFSGQGLLPSLELLERSFWTKVSDLEGAERRAGYSLVGPHRDDWAFFLGNQTLKGHGSQGEVRSALLALKLCEIELFRNSTGHRPLFLMDDFSSELDRGRRLFLLKFLLETDLQTFVTTTEDSSFVGKRFWISHGVIEEGTDDDRTKKF
jgi:DNA replication and repair protein RecF